MPSMFDWRFDWSKKKATGCPSYRARLQKSLVEGAVDMEADAGLSAHVAECARCREALDDAWLASRLVRDAQRPVEHSSEAFVTRVMIAVRDAGSRVSDPETIWQPLEFLASRVALVAGVVLLAFSLYLAQWAPVRATPPIAAPAEAGAGLPEPPASPATADEILMSLAEVGNAI